MVDQQYTLPHVQLPYRRDLIGYGKNPPQANWPGNARIAVQFVMNYEEGSENCILNGDAGSEQFLSEIIGADAYHARHLSMESIYEYGSRAGVWRILREFERRKLPLTCFGVGLALEQNPEVAHAVVEAGHEIACHGYRWIHYQHVPEAVEREHIQRCTEIVTKILGHHPEGWYTGRDSPNTIRIVAEEGQYLYDADYYGDDLPFWLNVGLGDGSTRPQLIVPYTLDTNDMRFASPQGFNTADHFFNYLKDAFDVLYAEGETTPKMMSVGLHCRLSGHPARLPGVQRFLDYIQKHDRVWIARRADIARHWVKEHPYKAA
ncbi:MAG TPA: allantoinase PuuE [Nevskiaceae bacterium]|nr:allantoinase PuuE [Nevskiaceae bacterium]